MATLAIRELPDQNLCKDCGACCDYSSDWPRFSLETEAEIALIPEALLASDQSGMGCLGNRCLALRGIVGQSTACSIYSVRPLVCRDCQPGDDACQMARQRHGLAPLAC